MIRLIGNFFIPNLPHKEEMKYRYLCLRNARHSCSPVFSSIIDDLQEKYWFFIYILYKTNYWSLYKEILCFIKCEVSYLNFRNFLCHWYLFYVSKIPWTNASHSNFNVKSKLKIWWQLVIVWNGNETAFEWYCAL